MVWSNGDFVEARNLVVGDKMMALSGDLTELVDINSFFSQGLYVPLLDGDGTVYADGLLAHTMTHVGQFGLPADLSFIVTKQLAQMTTDGADVPDDAEYRNPFVDWISWLVGYRGYTKTVLDITYSVVKNDHNDNNTLVIHSLNTDNNDQFVKDLQDLLNDHNAAEINADNLSQQTARYSPDGDPIQVLSSGRRGTRTKNGSSKSSSKTSKEQSRDDKKSRAARTIAFALLTHWTHTLFSTIVVDGINFNATTTATTAPTTAPTTTTTTT
jgi:hypothetical protein